MLLPLIAILVFASVMMLVIQLTRPRRRIVLRRTAAQRAGAVAFREPERTEVSLVRRVILPSLVGAGHQLANLLPVNWIRGTDRMLTVADEPWSLAGFLGVWALVTGAGVVVALYVTASLRASSSVGVLLLGATIVGFAASLPYLRLRSMGSRRRKAIVHALPDALDLLTTSVEAGLSVDAAFALVAEKTEGPLAETFALYLRQVGLGRARQEAFAYVAGRTGVSDLVSIAQNVNQGEELGTPLGEVLRQQADELRRLRRERAQIAAQRAPVLMTIPMALCFLPAMAAVVVVPAILNVTQFIGNLGR